MSSKQFKLITILVAIIVVFTTAYFVIDKRISKKESEQPSSLTNIEIFNFDIENIAEVLIKNKDGEFAFTRENNKWLQKGSEQFNFNQYILNDIINNMSTLQALEIITESAEDLSLYGLDSPSVVITCITDSNKYILEIGKPSITKNSYYVKKQGEMTVYSIDYNKGLTFDITKEDLKDIYLFDALSSEVMGISLECDGAVVYSVSKSNTSGWIMNQPLATERTNVANITSMVDSIIRINIANFIQENVQDYSEYGFDNPSYILEISSESKTEKILFGKTVSETNEIYAMFESSKDVVTFYRNNLSLMDLTAENLLLDTIHTENVYDLSKLEIIVNGELTTLTFEASADDLTNAKYTYNGTDINALGDDAVKLFINFYSSIVGVYFDHLDLDAQPDTSLEPEISFTYTRKSEPETVTISFIRESENTFYAIKHGEYTGFVVRLKTFHEDRGLFKTQDALVRYINEHS